MRFKIKKNYWQQDIRRRDYLLATLVGVLAILMISYLFYGTLSVCNSIVTLFNLFFKIMGKTMDRKKEKYVSIAV